MGNCPSRRTDLASVIQLNWTAPERPNGILLRYYLWLTNYDGTSVIATESVGSSDVIGQLDSSELRECQDNCDFYLIWLMYLYCTLLLSLPQRRVFPTLLASLQRTQLAMEQSVMSLTSQTNLVSFNAILHSSCS